MAASDLGHMELFMIGHDGRFSEEFQSVSEQ